MHFFYTEHVLHEDFDNNSYTNSLWLKQVKYKKTLGNRPCFAFIVECTLC